ncbi:GDP-mannose-dependent alpha-(1-6)-phosphatidylinositol monomannoside mannosyltransferase [mine drainage metagenome]|uniref:GDP-mannose-dependent alpha-(1-6)-phosphatidylinositol monomannoside mannosyltransferase n=1 Tax=mine drainage metagenome TaxID=410659 RepID=A0A1J5R6G7_9ZZZZ
MTQILFIGKRHYTNRDALAERYGRIYQLPLHWSMQGAQTRLWLIDYHGRPREQRHDEALQVDSTPIRGLSWIGKAAGLVLDRFRRRAPTHIIASGDAYIGLLGWLLARLTGAYFVFDVYDKYDEFGGYRKPFGWDLFRVLLCHADQCWFASRRLLAQLGKTARGDRLVMNGIDTDRFKPLDRREARQRLGLPDTAVLVGYFGGLNAMRGIHDLIAAVQMLRGRGAAIELVLAGKMEDTIQLDTPGVRYLGNLPHAQIPWALAAVDVVAVPYRRSAYLDAASSVKFGEIMACGRPMVATKTPNLEDNFPDQTALLQDYLVPPEQPEALARAIARQVQDQKIAPAPSDMDWSALASSTLAALGALKLCERTSP